MPCSRTYGFGGSASGSFIPPSRRDSSKWSEQSMSNQRERMITPPVMGETFDAVVLPHLDAARRLARWLMSNEHDAEDVVQDASLRAFRYFRTFAGGSGRAWFLRIVRNTCVGWRSAGFHAPTDPFDEERHSSADPASDPETLLLHTDDVTLIERALPRSRSLS